MITRQKNFKLLLLYKPLNKRSNRSNSYYSLKNELQVLDESTEPDSASVSRSMLYHVNRNFPEKALRIFKTRLQTGSVKSVDVPTVTLALKACRSDPRLGRQIHGFAVYSGFVSCSSVSNSLMNMYSKSGEFSKALRLFEILRNPDIVAWNTILSGFKTSEDAFSFTLRMNYARIGFDPVSYTTILAFCSESEEFLFGIQLHCLSLKSGLSTELFVGNVLISFYSRCGNLSDAKTVFDEMPYRDLVTWNAMLSGYSQERDHGLNAISIFIEMVRESMDLDHISFSSAVSACGHEQNLELGKQIHGMAMKSGYGSHLSVCNLLISMYSKSEEIEDAKLVFRGMKERNVVSWTSIISIDEEHAVSLFNGMRSDGVYPNDVTFIGLLHSITTNNVVAQGKTVHGFCIKTGFLSEQDISNSLVTMYAKFNSMDECFEFFKQLKHRDITTWNSLISGFAQNGLYRNALETFLQAVTEFRPNHFTFGSALSAIADAEDISLEYGQRCHSYLIKFGLNTHQIVSSALLNMYAKRGSIHEARRVFNETPEITQYAWTAIISGYSVHGDYESAINLFTKMERKGIKPDSVTFLSVLTVCSRKGMVNEGKEMFDLMVEKYRIEPSREHYNTMVDLLSRAGKLDEAEGMMRKIPGRPGISVLQSLLGACQTYGNTEMAERISRVLMEWDPMESGPYMLVSNLYAEKGDWEKVAEIRRGMRKKGVKKLVGFSWADVGGSMSLHGFSAGDESHLRSREILGMAKFLGYDLKSFEPELVSV